MRSFAILLTAMILTFQANSQKAEEEVKATINELFAAMKNADSVTMRSLFTEQAILQSVTTDVEGKTKIASESLARFISSIGQLPKGAADEQITFSVIKIDGSVAMAWTPYKFYYNGKFSHCGINSFQLVRLNDSWKIHYIIDTRRKEACE